jgi:hypothetical protein
MQIRGLFMINEKWNLQTIPPKSHVDVAEFAYMLFDIARLEKERLGKPQDFLANYSLYRGNQSKQQSGRKGYTPANKTKMLVNLYFANIERTVSNITARNPTGEVVDLDGRSDGSENILSMQLKKWWKETNQQTKTRASAREMELYGPTFEKPYWDKAKDRPDIGITDPFSFFPCPGNWEDLSTDCPYVCFAYVDFISNIEAEFGVKDIAPDEAYELMGAEREDYKPQGYGNRQSIGNYSDAMTVKRQDQALDNKALERCLVIEVWIRDNRKSLKTLTQPILDAQGVQAVNELGEPLVAVASANEPVYPDGIRKITITKTKDPKVKSGVIVLDDSANPNINPALPVEQARNTYPWGRLPVYHANSYKDGVSIWGFAAAEQVGDLLEKINIIIMKLVAYVINVMAPPLIIQAHCGITREMVESDNNKSGRQVFMPTTPNARIEFMQIPNLPQTFFQVLDLITRFFDRVYQIEDADRGVAPTGVIAASAIVALQERNQVLMQTKTSAIDNLAEQRSRWAIGLYQNFGTVEDSVNVGGQTVPFMGVQFAGRKYNYVVEAGSTTPRTSLQNQELVMSLSDRKLLSRRYVLETLNLPNWKEEIERGGEDQLDMALQVLIEAGLDKNAALELKQYLIQPQGGPGDSQRTPSSQPKPGMPKAQQGVQQ